MGDVHFQADLFSEIIGGLSNTIQELSAEKLVDVATKIYISLSKKSEASAAAGETSFVVCEEFRRQIMCSGTLECKSCGHKEGKFIGMELNFCPGCGRKIKETRK